MVIFESIYYKRNLQLAIPIIIANLGQATVGIVDNIMVGRLGADELAAASLGTIIFTNLMVLGMGVALSLTPLIGEVYAVGNYKKVSNLFQNSMFLNGGIGVILFVLLCIITSMLQYMGQDPGVVELSKPFLYIISISIFPFMLFMSFKHFMEGVGNTKVAMVITIGSNILNVILNYLLIYGKFGFPMLGIEGAAIATLISRCAMPIAFFVYLRTNHRFKRYLYFFNSKNLAIKTQKKLLNVGMPISAQMVMEVFALSMTAVMMGWISKYALAANQIVLSVTGFMFMIACGFSGAVTILVSHGRGAGKPNQVLGRYMYAGVQMSLIVMFFAAILFVFFGKYIAMVFTPDMRVVEIATYLFYVAALFEMSDGFQITVLGGLRGLKDVKYPMMIAFISYLLLNIPLAYILGFVLGLNEVGIWLGFFIGLSTACILLITRFRYILNK